MEWVSTLFGFFLGLAGSLLTMTIHRRWAAKDDERYTKKIVDALITEIEEAVDRVKYLIHLRDEEKVSFSRLYKALWESTNKRLASTLSNSEILKLLHRIYYRFDLINFNCELGRPGAGAAFAEVHLQEVEINLKKLKELLRPSSGEPRLDVQ